MGLDYSFRFVVPRDRANALLAAVADQALDEYSQRLRKALPWTPQNPHTAEAGVRGLQSCSNDTPNHYALILLFPLDAEIEDYLTDPDGWRPNNMVGDKAAIGNVYMDVYAGREFLLLSLWAATSDMSRMFEASPTARATMITIARTAQASALFFDSERDDQWELLPQANHVPQPPEMDPDRIESVDEYCKQALELAGLA